MRTCRRKYQALDIFVVEFGRDRGRRKGAATVAPEVNLLIVSLVKILNDLARIGCMFFAVSECCVHPVFMIRRRGEQGNDVPGSAHYTAGLFMCRQTTSDSLQSSSFYDHISVYCLGTV